MYQVSEFNLDSSSNIMTKQLYILLTSLRSFGSLLFLLGLDECLRHITINILFTVILLPIKSEDFFILRLKLSKSFLSLKKARFIIQ